MVIDGHCLECDGNGYHIEDCPHRMRYARLRAAEKAENEGRGIKCMQALLAHLENSEIDKAQAIWQNDGDKIRAYPNVEELCKQIFGCRLHLKVDCDKCT